MEYYIIPPGIKQKFYDEMKVKTKDLYDVVCKYMSFKDKMLIYSFGDVSKIFKDKKENSLFIGVDNDIIKKIGSYYIPKITLDEKCFCGKTIYINIDDYFLGKEGVEIINLLRKKGKILGINIDDIINVFESVDIFINIKCIGKMRINFVSDNKKELIECFVVAEANFGFKMKDNFITKGKDNQNEKKEDKIAKVD